MPSGTEISMDWRLTAFPIVQCRNQRTIPKCPDDAATETRPEKLTASARRTAPTAAASSFFQVRRKSIRISRPPRSVPAPAERMREAPIRRQDMPIRQ
jgi:hypothetical protein